jgi:cytochrome c oxidase cbb3-type subunit III
MAPLTKEVDSMLDDHKHKHAVHDFDGLIEIRSNPIPHYFALLFYGLVIWAVLFMAYFFLSGWSSEGHFARKMGEHQERIASQQPTAVPVVDEQTLREEATRLYSQHCTMCHGAGGEGGIGPALNTPDYIYGRDQAAIVKSIAQGHPGGMPGYSKQFSTTQIEALANYLISL